MLLWKIDFAPSWKNKKESTPLSLMTSSCSWQQNVPPAWHLGLGFAHIHWTIWLLPMGLLVWIRQAGFDLNISFQDQASGTETVRKQALSQPEIFYKHRSRCLPLDFHIYYFGKVFPLYEHFLVSLYTFLHVWQVQIKITCELETLHAYFVFSIICELLGRLG